MKTRGSSSIPSSSPGAADAVIVGDATLRIPEARMRGRADVVVGVRPEDIFVGAGVALERVHFFDPRTKTRIPG